MAFKNESLTTKKETNLKARPKSETNHPHIPQEMGDFLTKGVSLEKLVSKPVQLAQNFRNCKVTGPRPVGGLPRLLSFPLSRYLSLKIRSEFQTPPFQGCQSEGLKDRRSSPWDKPATSFF